MIIISSILAVCLLCFCYIGFLQHKMKAALAMSSAECIAYDTAGTDSAYITVGIIKDGCKSWTVYGRDGKKLPPHEYFYEVGSISKTFTASLLCKALQDGKISLDDNIATYLDFSSQKTVPSYTPTIRRLATHTSGYGSVIHSPMIRNILRDNSFYGFNCRDLVRVASGKNVADKNYPWAYSNFGMACLGEVLASVYGGQKPLFADSMTEYLRNDLHLSKTTVFYQEEAGHGAFAEKMPDAFRFWHWKKDDSYLAAGSIVSTVTDMLSYLQLHIDAENNSGNALHYLTESHKIHAHIQPVTKLNVCIEAMGLAWVHDRTHNIIWHNGGTAQFNSYCGFDAQNKLGVVVLMNKTPNYRIPATVIGAKLFDELRK